MRDLFAIFLRLLRANSWAMARGWALSLTVLVMGAALLGLSGWFIVAAAAAGLIGMGSVFDVFRPSAMVRFLALGRAAGRYGERLLTHDATLRGLEALRADVLRGYLGAGYRTITRIRGAQALNRLTADVDALDGVSLRLFLPVMAALGTHALVYLVLHWLLGGMIAAWIGLGYTLGGALILIWAARASARVARAREEAAQSFRTGLIDMIRARRDLAVYGRLAGQAAQVQAAQDLHDGFSQRQDAAERRVGLALNLLLQLVAAGALGLGIATVNAGGFAPSYAALGFFAALGLAETIAPLRRLAPDLGRMRMAATRVRGHLPGPEAPASPAVIPPRSAQLTVSHLSLCRPDTAQPIIEDLSFDLGPGQWLAVTGASGRGKSTLLLALAGLMPFDGEIRLGQIPIATLDEAFLRERVAYLPQRSALMAGTLRENLCLGDDRITDADLDAVIDACALREVIRLRGGLDMVIGPRGEGLSGGEARRVTLARLLLRRPDLLLLDEPTEGLDDATALHVLREIRAILPQSAILSASHKHVEVEISDMVITL
ncbi:ATP-binding cassette domain-containing protein [Thioclava sp. 'Guangxiensis']|uniref:amino acid ABC transporter ATP-binding/permease protein n=1 Tax=Thioclava sp. 'Guangxiensis' TaxID=3149044 RepID=UPI0038781F56